jgi:hypothetical protein
MNDILQYSKSQSDIEYIKDNELTLRYYTELLAFYPRLDNPILQALSAWSDVFYHQLADYSTNRKLPVDKISAPSFIAELKRKIEICIEYKNAIELLEKTRTIQTAFNR